MDYLKYYYYILDIYKLKLFPMLFSSVDEHIFTIINITSFNEDGKLLSIPNGLKKINVQALISYDIKNVLERQKGQQNGLTDGISQESIM